MRHIGKNILLGLRTAVSDPIATGPRRHLPSQRHLAIGVGVAILLVALAMLLLDAWSLENVRRLPQAIIATFHVLTDFGLSGWFLGPLGLMLAMIAAVNTGVLPRYMLVVIAAVATRTAFVFAAIAVPGLFVAILKRLIGRARPYVGEQNTWDYLPFVWRSEYASIPSGHATTSFAAAIAIGAVWPRARPVMWVYAALMALSRIAVTAHYPSDVIAGAIVGTVGALLVRNWFAERNLGFFVGADSRIHAAAGPSLRRMKAVLRRLVFRRSPA